MKKEILQENMADIVAKYPVRTGLGFGVTMAIGFYVMPPKRAKILGSVLIGVMGGGIYFVRTCIKYDYVYVQYV